MGTLRRLAPAAGDVTLALAAEARAALRLAERAIHASPPRYRAGPAAAPY